MKSLKKIISVTLLLALLLFFFEGPIFRLCVAYKSIGIKSTSMFALPEIQEVNTQEGLLNVSHQFVNTNLKFSDATLAQNPIATITSGKANCVGYAALFTAYFNLSANTHGLKLRAEHHKGELYFLGINMHQFSSSPFFKDHDFVMVTHTETKEKIALDPTVSDYFGIRKVSVK